MICKAFVLVKEITKKENEVIASNAKANSKRIQSKSCERIENCAQMQIRNANDRKRINLNLTLIRIQVNLKQPMQGH